MRIEHQVVRTDKPSTVAAVVEPLDLARLGIDDINRAALIVRRLQTCTQSIAFTNPTKTTVVGDVNFAVRTHRGAIRTAVHLGDQFDTPIRADASESLALDFDKKHRPV